MPADPNPGLPVSTGTWRCCDCGTEYTSDVGPCGQLLPPCNGVVEAVPATTDTDVIGALRLALAGASSDEAALTVIAELLAMAPPTDRSNTRSVEVFIAAIKATNCRFEVTR